MTDQLAPPNQTKVPCCTSCGSEDVLRDAWAAWDAASGDWTLAAVFDAAWCNHCDGPTHLRWKALSDHQKPGKLTA